jgi:hypothetical protein
MAIKLDNIKVTHITDSFKSGVENIYGNLISALAASRSDKSLESSIRRLASPRWLDRTYTSLKRLPYSRFTCVKAPDNEVYLAGKTDDIVVEIHGNNYNIGPYHVFISTNSIIDKQVTPIHLIPGYDPQTKNRHLHHLATYGDYAPSSPLLYEPRWCWASIGPSYYGALHDVDIVDMFRLLYLFLIRLNFSSPLCTQWINEAMHHGELL